MAEEDKSTTATSNDDQSSSQGSNTNVQIVNEPDGALKIGEVRYVPESDLLANKEANARRLDELAAAHKEELSKYMGDSNSIQQLLLQTQAERDTLKEQLEVASKAKAELEQTKADLESVRNSLNTHSELALSYRKKWIAKEYGVSPDKLEGKDMNQLGFFEEALSAVASAGNGNLAVASGGAGVAKPTDPIARAKLAIEQAEKANRPS